DPRALDAEVAPGDDLADEAEDAGQPRRAGEDRGRDGEPTAVRALPLGHVHALLVGRGFTHARRIFPEAAAAPASATIAPPAPSGPFRMPNIQQQKKRVRIAARQRLENLRYRSTIKTLTKRLETAVEDA